MRLSHSKLSTILSCPMTYFLRFEEEMWQKVEKPALAIGSAVHWGIEHDTDDLSDFYKERGTFKQGDNYTEDQIMAEAMVRGYLRRKDEIFDQLLTHPVTQKKLTLLEETHELFLTAKLFNSVVPKDHEFVGIIDLLVLTDEGFIVIDYKTSTFEPDWDGYLDQLYRYIFEVQQNFPDIPLLKIGIINVRKSRIRQKKGETRFEFIQRFKTLYENDDSLINYHEFLPSDINDNHIHDYVNNLRIQCDMAETIRRERLYFINYGAAKGAYGKSEFYDIFYRTPGAESLYAIKDKIWNDADERFDDHRDCIELDMRAIEFTSNPANLINKYEHFKRFIEPGDKYTDIIDKLDVSDCVYDKALCARYYETYVHEQEVMNESE